MPINVKSGHLFHRIYFTIFIAMLLTTSLNQTYGFDVIWYLLQVQGCTHRAKLICVCITTVSLSHLLFLVILNYMLLTGDIMYCQQEILERLWTQSQGNSFCYYECSDELFSVNNSCHVVQRVQLAACFLLVSCLL